MKRSSLSKDFKCDDKARDAFRIICNGLNTPLAASVVGLSDVQLNALSISPSDYSDVQSFYEDWLAVNLMSKYPKLNLGIDTKAVAFEKFKEAETACAETNLRLFLPSPQWGVEAVISTARRKISRLLGSFSWDSCEPFFGFSGGASTRFKRRDAQPQNKFSFSTRPHVTKACYPLLDAFLRFNEHGPYGQYVRELGSVTTIVAGNKLATVPKNAKTDRVIAIEPDWNMFFQRGIGGLLRARLKRVGVDLDTQAKNQNLAHQGSVYGRLATVDLSAASDSISLGICELLLPPDWLSAILRTRSSEGVLPNGDVISYQKVSSMGNGFTFELESLIFWALTVASKEVYCLDGSVVDHRIAVYGDDIIVDSAVVPLLSEVFKYCGFTFNEGKSFVSGPFRESCGKHYFRGCDVTPFYIRKPVTNVYRLFWLCNSYRRWTYRFTGFSPMYYFDTWKKLVTKIPKRFRALSVPDNAGDGGVLRSLADAKPSFAGWRYSVPVIRPLTAHSEVAQHLGYFDALFRGRGEKSPLIFNGTMWVPRVYHRNSYNIDAKGTLRSQQSSSIDISIVDPDEYRIRRYRSVGWDDPQPWVVVSDDRPQFSLLRAV